MSVTFDEYNRRYVVKFHYFGERTIYVYEKAVLVNKQAIRIALDEEIRRVNEEVSNYEANLYF